MEVLFREPQVDYQKFVSILERTTTLTPENNDVAVKVLETNCYESFLEFLKKIEGKFRIPFLSITP